MGRGLILHAFSWLSNIPFDGQTTCSLCINTETWTFGSFYLGAIVTKTARDVCVRTPFKDYRHHPRTTNWACSSPVNHLVITSSQSYQRITIYSRAFYHPSSPPSSLQCFCLPPPQPPPQSWQPLICILPLRLPVLDILRR